MERWMVAVEEGGSFHLIHTNTVTELHFFTPTRCDDADGDGASSDGWAD